MGCGVIGNTADSGSVVLGSSPGTPAKLAFRLVPPHDVIAGWQISYYNIVMAKKNTIRGEKVTERQIDEWVAEAEAGFDVEALKKRGRPGRSPEPSQVVALRLTAEELAALDMRAQREGKSRSEVIRDALSESAA